MSLSEIKEKLYKKGKEEVITNYTGVDFDPKKISDDPLKTDFVKNDDVWRENKNELLVEKTTAFGVASIVLSVIFLISSLSVGFYFFKKSSFSEERVVVSMSGQDESSSGKTIEYEISYNNNNRATLKNAFLKISYPDTFIPENNANFKLEGRMAGTIQLGDIAGKGQGKIIFKGKAYNPKGTIIYIKTELFYSPSGFSGQFIASNQIGLNVSSSPITLNFLAPQAVSNGDAIDYLIDYRNDGIEDLENIRVSFDYPEGFVFSKSVPEALANDSNNNSTSSWDIGRLTAGQGGKIIVSGKLSGMKDEVKSARVYIGEGDNENKIIVQNNERAETRIGSSPLAIEQYINGEESLSFNAGDLLKFQVNYKNEGSVGLRDVIITAKIEGEMVDYSKLEGAVFNMENKTITWKASAIPELKFLEPGKKGTIYFEIATKNMIPANSDSDKNFIISTVAKIDSPDIPTPIQGNKIISGNRMDIKLNSKLILDEKGFYKDDYNKNSGPIPPAIGKETFYTIKWKLFNVSNNVKDVRVESALPNGVVMSGKIYPEGEKLTYNERTNSISWEVGNMLAGSGFYLPAKEVSFQIKAIPSPNQLGAWMELVGSAKASGKDLFTNDDIETVIDKKMSNLTEDSSIGERGYIVVE